MRAVTFLMRDPVGVSPIDPLSQGDDELTRDRIYQLNLLEDGTMVLLGRLKGDVERARRVLRSVSEVIGFSLSPVGEDAILGFVHARPPPVVSEFLALPRRHEVFFEFPIESTREGHFRVVMIGESNDVLRSALADVPAALDVEIERIGELGPARGELAGLLTARQEEVLEAAMELGYYAVPRTATQADIAAALDRSTGTVAEHLRKLEARVFGALFG